MGGYTKDSLLRDGLVGISTILLDLIANTRQERGQDKVRATLEWR